MVDWALKKKPMTYLPTLFSSSPGQGDPAVPTPGAAGYVLDEVVPFLCLGFVPAGDRMTLRQRRQGETDFAEVRPLSALPTVFTELHCVDTVSTVFRVTVEASWNNSDVICQVTRTLAAGPGEAGGEVVLATSEAVLVQVIDGECVFCICVQLCCPSSFLSFCVPP